MQKSFLFCVSQLSHAGIIEPCLFFSAFSSFSCFFSESFALAIGSSKRKGPGIMENLLSCLIYDLKLSFMLWLLALVTLMGRVGLLPLPCQTFARA